MLNLKNVILGGAIFASTAAMAAPARVSDSQYLELNRCRALIASTDLGGGDTKSVDALLRIQGRGRDVYTSDRGDELQGDTARAAHHANTDGRARLIAERDGKCQSLIGTVTATSGSAGKPSSIH